MAHRDPSKPAGFRGYFEWFVPPLFALANAGVRIDAHIFEAPANPLGLEIVP